VLLGGAVTALSVARSLGSAGVPVVILGDGGTDCLARRSRWCGRYVHFARRGTDDDVKERWLEWLLAGRTPSVLLPCCDEGVELVARRRSELGAVGHLPVEADDRVLLAMLNKPESYRLASAAGVVVPRTITVRSPDDRGAVLGEGLGFPLAVKPTRSDVLMQRLPGYRAPKGAVVHDERELDATLRTVLSAGVDVLVTEIIPGGDDRFCSYYSYLDEHGEPLLHFTKRKPRQYPIGFGTGTYHITQWQPDVARTGLRFFQGVGLRGLGNVEFKRDPRDGELKLIECNPRFTMANGLARIAGIDFALLAYNRLLGRPLPPVDSFRDGERLWFPAKDLRACRAYRADGQLPRGAWLATLARRPHLPNWDWRDPVPSLVGLRGRLRRPPRRP